MAGQGLCRRRFRYGAVEEQQGHVGTTPCTVGQRAGALRLHRVRSRRVDHARVHARDDGGLSRDRVHVRVRVRVRVLRGRGRGRGSCS